MQLVPGGLRVFAGSFAFVALVAGAGTLATDIGPWYLALQQPSWKPPDAWFGAIWSSIFLLLAIAVTIGWQKADARGRQKIAIALFINGVLNVSWSVLFFAMRRPDLALAEWGVFWLSIVVLMVLLWRQRALAGALLIPYLVWVSVAGKLNHTVIALNPALRG
jgi:tryptophan-rich sensory protein